jgi:phosphate acyltransferase
MITIGLDMLGGDFAPEKAVQGLHHFYAQNADFGNKVTTVCFGNEADLITLFKNYELPMKAIKIVHAPTTIGMNEHPTKALKEKKDTSLFTGFTELKQQNINAFISAGNTGCMLVGSMLFLKTLPGVQRPAIPTIIPKLNGATGVLLDVGLNADCKPENLNQFAYLGSQYAKQMLGINNPKVALINIGEEEGKGNILSQAAYQLLKNNSHINFIGNAEGRDVLTGDADVMVCDGFVGNIVLKLAESFYGISLKLKLENLYFQRFNFEQYGGMPVLGVEKPVIIGHGISGAEAFKNMINTAVKMCQLGSSAYEIAF